ncbi:hypothetical protein HY501_00725 [Candidatus Woesearchaeota archaeon]|nr:hypothetical protein [Candidatus Woesearchaeota archaeon]
MRLAAELKKRWVIFFLLFIVILGTYVRTLDYRWPYLRNIDSYNFYSEMEDIAEDGYLSPRDPLKLAPHGTDRGQDFYAYAVAYPYIFFSLFADMPLWEFMIWFPPFLAALMAVPMYFIAKTLYDRKAGLIAAAFIVFDTSIIARTLGGDPDSDVMVMIMPLVIIALFLFMYRIADKSKITPKLMLLAVLTGLSLVAWRLTWGGFWFVIWLITGFLILKLIVDFIRTKNWRRVWATRRTLLAAYVVMMAVFFAFTLPMFGTSVVEATITGPIQFPEIKSEGGTFPNVYVSVAELQNPGSIRDIIARVGVSFFLLIFSLIYLLYSFIKKRQHLDTVILLGIWFLGPFLATIVAVRFTILFAAPIAIGTGIFFSKLLRLASGEDKAVED